MQSESGLARVLLCPPPLPEEEEHAAAEPASVASLQCLQWKGVKQAFADAGFSAELLPLPGVLFPGGYVFVGWHLQQGPFVVPANPREPERRAQVAAMVSFFRRHGYEVVNLHLWPEEYFDGHADLLWHDDLSLVWAGYGFRTSFGAVEKFASAVRPMNITTVPLALNARPFTNLDTCLAPLTPDSVMIYPGAFSRDALRAIHDHCSRVHEIPKEDALRLVCSGVAANGRFITPALTPALEGVLSAEGLQPVVVEASAFENAGGGICCMKLFIA